MENEKKEKQPAEKTAVEAAKTHLREVMRPRRRLAAEAAGPDAANAVMRHFLGCAEEIGVAEGVVVSAYWPLRSELDVRPLLHRLYDLGAVCALPVVGGPGEPLLFRVWEPGDLLQDGRLGIQQPGPEAPCVVPQVLVTPLVAFDRQGWRLGLGGGYYDRTIKLLRARGNPVAVGVAYAIQGVPAVPHAADDMRVDWIVTENGIEKIGP